MHGLNTVVYLLNKVPCKVVSKTHFELWIERKPSLGHLYVWGCPMKVRIYNPKKRNWIQKQSMVSSLVI